MNKVLLDGEYVEPSAIDPAKHRYLGMFRPATIEPMAGHCPVCHGSTSSYAHGIDMDSHLKKGCYDMPQYVTIKEGE